MFSDLWKIKCFQLCCLKYWTKFLILTELEIHSKILMVLQYMFPSRCLPQSLWSWHPILSSDIPPLFVQIYKNPQCILWNVGSYWIEKIVVIFPDIEQDCEIHCLHSLLIHGLIIHTCLLRSRVSDLGKIQIYFIFCSAWLDVFNWSVITALIIGTNLWWVLFSYFHDEKGFKGDLLDSYSSSWNYMRFCPAGMLKFAGKHS